MQAVRILREQADHLNTPRLIADATGTAVWRNDNAEPFGDSPANEDPSGLGAFEFPLGFGGWQYADNETGAFWNWMRTYSRGTGRFDQSDSRGLTYHLNTYSYANFNPLWYTDPTGEQATASWCFGGPMACAAGVTLAVGSLIWAQSQQSKKKSGASSSSCPGNCPPCDPPEGTRCYRHDFGHAHADIAANQSHFHFHVMEQIPSTCECIWKEKFGPRGHVDFPPRGLRECSTFPSWTTQYGVR